MTGWLLDTNVLSELRKPRPNPGVRTWSDKQPADRLFVSTITLAEIRYGIERQPNPAFRNELTAWLDRLIRPWFEGRVLPVDEDVIVAWRHMVARGKARGIVFSQPDLFIAATAQIHGITLVTRNERNFRETDVPVLNPWTE